MSYAINEMEKAIVLKSIKKRRMIYTLCFLAAWVLIAVCGLLVNKVHFLFIIPALILLFGACLMASFNVWCINNYRSVLTDGQTGGGGFVWFFWLLVGGLVFPIVITVILRHTDFGYKVLGCEKAE